MAERIPKPERKTEAIPEEASASKVGSAAARGAEVVDATDNLLDEIDEVLEVNAEDFVRNYIQKGGQ